jgi:hypothetical protein
MIIRVIRLLSLLLDVFSYVKQTLQMAPLSELVFEIHKIHCVYSVDVTETSNEHLKFHSI